MANTEVATIFEADLQVEARLQRSDRDVRGNWSMCGQDAQALLLLQQGIPCILRCKNCCIKRNFRRSFCKKAICNHFATLARNYDVMVRTRPAWGPY
jgi:hypothetical protein